MPLSWLRDLLFESRAKWKEIKDWKRYFSMAQLALAELFRWLFLLLLGCSILLTGIGAAGLDSSEEFISVRHYLWSDGSTSTETTGECCANIACLISTAAILAGLGCFLGSLACFALAVLFWILSFIWLFRTDEQFHAHYAAKLDHQYMKLNNQLSMQPKHPHDEPYMVEFNRNREEKVLKIRAKIEAIEAERDAKNAKRPGSNKQPATPAQKHAPVDTEDADDVVATATVGIPVVEVQTVDDLEAELNVGMLLYLTTVETAAVEHQVDLYQEAELEEFPKKVQELMKSEDMTEAEVKSALRRTIYQDFCTEITEVRQQARHDARIRVRVAVKQYADGTMSEDSEELMATLRRLNDKSPA